MADENTTKSRKYTNYGIYNEQLENGAEKTGWLEEKIIQANQGLIINQIQKLGVPSGDDVYEDLMLEGMLAVSKAFKNFDYTRGIKFSTLATKYVRNALISELKKIRAGEGEETYFDDMAYDSSVDLESSFVSSEEREAESARIRKFLFSKKKTDFDVELYLETLGLIDGKCKSVNDLIKLTGKKRSAIVKKIRTCIRLCREEEIRKNGKPEEEIKKLGMIKEKDLALMQYIIEQNRKEGDAAQFPNWTDIQKSYLSQYFSNRGAVSRSIEKLRDIRGCVISNKGVRQGYCIENPESVDGKLNLTSDEYFTVSTISVLLSQYKNTPLEKTFNSVWEKVTENLDGVIMDERYMVNKSVSMVTDPLPELDKDVFNSIIKACRNKQTISFCYNSQSSGLSETREADPYHIVCNKGSWYMIAFCHKRNKPLWFAFPRVSDVHILKTHFEKDSAFNLENFFTKENGMVWAGENTQKKVKLLISKKIALYMTERPWFKDSSFTENDDGSVIMEFSTTQDQNLVKLIMEYTPLIKVLEPESLVEKVRKLAEETLKLYE